MKRPMGSPSWLAALAILGFVCAGGVLLAPSHADAFTLIEHLATPPVELLPAQTAHLEYRNLSNNSVHVILAFIDWGDASQLPFVEQNKFNGDVLPGQGAAIDLSVATTRTIIAVLIIDDPLLQQAPAFLPLASLQIMERGRTVLLPAVQRVRTVIP